MCVLSRSVVTLFDLMDVAHQAPLSLGFFRREYWSGLPFYTLVGHSNPEMKPTSISPALAGGFFTTALLGKPYTPIIKK